MDWHFRQNRRLKNQSKQTLCRGWQDISEDDWIDSKTIEGKFTTPTFFQFDASNPETEDTENNEDEKEKIKYLPSDGTPKKCYICKEDFEKHWHEDEEEWMLKNAIEKEGKVFHPSCYSDYVSQKKILNKIKDTTATSEVKQKDTNTTEIEKQELEPKPVKSKAIINNTETEKIDGNNRMNKEKRRFDELEEEESQLSSKENDNKKIKLE
jgi:hypothetical protein